MSADVEEKLSALQLEGSSEESLWKPSIAYSREFLLSLSELDACKKLPSDFDESLLSEFSEASSYGTQFQDRQRGPPSSPLQGYRRSEYGSSPPTKGDSGNYSRGIQRWDSRSSVRSDTDSESESGRRYAPPRRPVQQPEHDGLLGSGSFPRPPGFAAGAPGPRYRPNGNSHLNRTNEPYQPPRPYKAGPHLKRETNDSFNDETFGSADSASDDRAEEEKKRRAEFELMRKEQHKVLQEKQKTNSGKLGDPFSDLMGLLTSDNKASGASDEEVKQVPPDDSSKLPIVSHAPPSRPLVPPGFVNSVVDKTTTKSLIHSVPLEVGNLKPEDNPQDSKSTIQECGPSELHTLTTNTSVSKPEKTLDLSSIFQGREPMKPSSLPDVNEVLENGEILGLDSEVSGPKILGEPRRSTSILEKLFGNSLTAGSDSTSNFVEVHDAETTDTRSPSKVQSKFARWFPEEEKNSLGDISFQKPNNLLSLIGGGEKGGLDTYDAKAVEPAMAPKKMLGVTTSKSSASTEDSERLSDINGSNSKPSVLTCEDLEQSILSNVGGSGSTGNPHPRKENCALDSKTGRPSAAVDSQASQHLLSLLQGGMGPKMASVSDVVEGSHDKFHRGEVEKSNPFDAFKSSDSGGSNRSGNSLTLEALFGTAFMNELHSTQNNSGGAAGMDAPKHGSLPFSVADTTVHPPGVSDVGSIMGINDVNILAPNDRFSKMDNIGHLLGLHDPVKDVGFSNSSTEIHSKFGGADGGMDVRLPEEDSLITLSDPINTQNPMLIRDSSLSKMDMVSSSNTRVNAIENFASLGPMFNDRRSVMGGQDPFLLHGQYDMVKPELPQQNMNQQASSAQMQAPHLNHGGPLFQGLDSRSSHFDPHLKFMPPEAPVQHQFPGNMGHPPLPHHSSGVPVGFDHPVPPILQQMHMAGGLPPHLARGFPGGPPMPPHPVHHPAGGFIQEHNPMQGFPYGQRPPNFGGPGMTLPGHDLGDANNPPEAFQRLLEMEYRANPKQMHPFAAGGHSRPMFGPELDMGFRYR